MDYYAVLVFLFPAAVPGINWALGTSDEGKTVITMWGVDAPVPTQEELEAGWAALQEQRALDELRAQARSALAGSDGIILQLIETHSDFIPDNWKGYRAALRSIAGATNIGEAGPIPSTPANPLG